MNDMKLIQEIERLKREKNATIIAHYYQNPEIQDMADFVGDSLAMAKYGLESKSDLLLICGVRFMAETAKILSPAKKILLSNSNAGCPMADMVDYEALKAYKKANPHRKVVTYVNTSAAVKSLADVCVTSSNALKVVSAMGEDPLVFIPDRNLGQYIKQRLVHRDIELWNGCCYTHDRVRVSDVLEARSKHKEAKLLVHPECDPAIVAMADYVGSTAGILSYAKNSSDQTFIVATEEGVLYPLQQENPYKKFYLATSKLVCKNMKKTQLSDLYKVLLSGDEAIELDQNILHKAHKALDNMLALS